jgi:hypothetical protein
MLIVDSFLREDYGPPISDNIPGKVTIAQVPAFFTLPFLGFFRFPWKKIQKKD